MIMDNESELIQDWSIGILKERCHSCGDKNRIVEHDNDLDLYKCGHCGELLADGHGVIH